MAPSTNNSTAATSTSQMAAHSTKTSSAGAASSSGTTRRILFTVGRGLNLAHRIIDRDADYDLHDDYDVADFDDGGSMTDGDETIEDEADDGHDNHHYGNETSHELSSGALSNAPRLVFGPEKPSPNTHKGASPSPSSAPQTSAAKSQASPAAPPRTLAPTAAPNPPKSNPLSPSQNAPFGYRIVKVKKPDGTVALVKRPLKQGESAPHQPQSQLPGNTAGKGVVEQATAPVQTTVPSEKHSSTQNPSSLSMEASTPTNAGKAKKSVEVTEKELNSAAGNDHSTPIKSKSYLHRALSGVQLFSWIIMITMPLFFLALAIAVVCMNGKAVPTSNGDRTVDSDPLTQAKLAAVSIWPIVFAAVVAQTFRAYAAYKVERGISLLTLEQLISSHSVGGAIKQPFLLRRCNWTSLILLIFWALSPLTGQGITHMLSQISVSDQVPAHAKYFAPHLVMQPELDNVYLDQDDEDRIDAIYSSLLLETVPNQNLPEDFWNNVRIPMYPVNAASNDTNDNGWIPVSPDAPLTSLLGIPVLGQIDDTAIVSVNFTISTSYFDLSCTPPVQHAVINPEMQALNFSRSASGTLLMSAENTTSRGTAPGPTGTIHFGSLVVESSVTISEPGATPTNSHEVFQGVIYYSACTYHQVMVLSDIYCYGNTDSESTALSCSVQGQKLNKTAMNDQTFQPLGSQIISTMLKVAGGREQGGDYTDTEAYILADDFATTQHAKTVEFTGLANVTADVLSERFGRLVNTLWMAGSNHVAFLGGDLSQPRGTFNGIQDLVDASTGLMVWSTHWQYVASPGWVALVMICSILLVLAGIAAAILEYRTVGPEFLGFANTALKRSVRMPSDMGKMNARERLRALQEREVLLQDIRPDAKVGKIALGLKEASSTRLIPGREYK